MQKTMGFIGYGNMGKAIASRLVEKNKIIAFDIDTTKLKDAPQTASSINELIEQSDYIWLCVKPNNIADVLEQIHDKVTNKLLISIAAGITTKFIYSKVKDSTALVRVMPNTPALIGEGMMVFTTKNVSDEDKSHIKTLLNSLGLAIELDEKYFDAVTALSGSGPAFVFLFIEALIEGGVRKGLPRNIAQQLAMQTIKGSVALLEHTQKNPYELIAQVSSPGGTTIEGLYNLYDKNFMSAIMSAISEAADKSAMLSK